MKKILLANIGNRNITYRGKMYPDLSKSITRGRSFRDFTKHLLDNLTRFQKHLSINILDTLLDAKSAEIESIILFASDQPHHQDTIHEADLLKVLIEEKYSISVTIDTIKCSVIDNDALMKTYRQKLKGYKTFYKNKPFMICDAGGTAQQKSALKILSEYLFEENEYEVIYVDRGKLNDVTQIEYKRIIAEEQVVGLIRQGEYQGAYLLYQQLPNKDRNYPFTQLLEFAQLRKHRLWKDAQKKIEDGLLKKVNWLIDYKNAIPTGNFDFFDADLSENSFFMLCDIFEIALFEWNTGDKTDAILGFSIFIESFLNHLIANKTTFNLTSGNDRYKHTQALSKYIEETHYEIVRFFDNERLKDGVPLNLKFAQTLNLQPNTRHVVEKFLELNSRTNGKGRGIDTLRNAIAHNGQGVTDANIKLNCPQISHFIDEMKILLDLPKESFTKKLNQSLIDIL